MLIRVNKCSVLSKWYEDYIGSIFDVDAEDSYSYYNSYQREWYFLKEDVDLISKGNTNGRC